MKLGILGGTFDPIHNGHIMMADESLVRLGLDEVLFIPAGHPRFKGRDSVSEASHRLQMLRLAISGKPAFRLSAMEIDRKGTTYTIDTVRELKKGLGAQDELFFIMGRDSLQDFPLWHKPDELITLCRLVVIPRAGWPELDLASLERLVAGLTEKTIVLDSPVIDISSSDIRERMKNGIEIRGLVPDAVADYITEKGLYR
jgi:nicotinate-nucleotide adenylyltransferase